MKEGQPAAYIVIDGPGHSSTRLALREGITSFGRLPANDVILPGDLVSRHHARIAFFEGRATLQDLGSHNGSWVDGERTASRVLEHGDTVRIGNFHLIFHQGSLGEGLDDTTAGADPDPSARSEQPQEDTEGIAALLRELEAAREGTKSSARALHFLYRATDALARAPDAHAYAAEMLDLALEHVSADGAAWLRVEGQKLRAEVTRGPAGPLDALEVHVPAVQWAIERSFFVRSEDVHTDPRFGSPAPATGASRESVLAAPLLDNADAGAIFLRRSVEPFGPSDLHRLGAIAHLMTEGLAWVERRQAELAERLLAGLHGPYAAARLATESAGGRAPVDGPIPVVAAVLDLHGLQTAAERTEPADVFGLLGAFHARASHAAEMHLGFSEALNGHRALLIFGCPQGAREADARAALDVTLELRAAVDRLLEDRAEMGPRRLRAGIARGPVVAGAVGGRRRSFAVLGPPTAAASRLVDAAGAGRILVDAATMDEAGPRYSTRKVGNQPGRPGEPARPIYELEGRQTAHR